MRNSPLGYPYSVVWIIVVPEAMPAFVCTIADRDRMQKASANRAIDQATQLPSRLSPKKSFG